ncbi:MAG: cytochrome c peroxidase [Saprospiraceae bacterium]|jgi:cytochrome c peroxidase
MKNKILFICSLIAFVSIISCKKEGVDIEYNYYPEEDFQLMSQYLNLDPVPVSYENDFPDYYSSAIRTYDRDLATLGRVLFYDKNLSLDKSISCASCHRQEIAFSDDKAFSNGVNQRKTSRNSLALGSVFSFNEYYGSSISGRVPFFWDNRASSVQEQSKATLGNPLEMDIDMQQVKSRVEEQPFYAPLFQAAYGHNVQNEQEILDAIAVFVNSIGSFNTKYDVAVDKYLGSHGSLNGIASADLADFNDQEQNGRKLYLANCSSCHGNIEEGVAAPGLIQANNGLAMDYGDDQGMGDTNSSSSFKGLFKVPTLRNIEKTGPYMHDGRLATLEDVVEHYSNGIQNHENLSTELKSGSQAVRFNYSESEKADLVAFLRTYTDEDFLTNSKYSDPFKQ